MGYSSQNVSKNRMLKCRNPTYFREIAGTLFKSEFTRLIIRTNKCQLFRYNICVSSKWTCSSVLLIVAQLVKKFPAFYGTQRFISMFIKTRHWNLSPTSCIQPTSYLFEIHFNIIIPSTSRSPRWPRPSNFWIICFMHFSCPSCFRFSM
jgi:hypothetical protein